MIFGWWKRRRRRKLLRSPFPEAWSEVLAELPFTRRLDDARSAKLRDHLRVLIAEKHWEGCGGLALTDEMRVSIAAQASRLILELPIEAYDRVTSILVYPRAFRTQETDTHSGVVAAGLASSAGPVVLSWDSTLRGGRDPDDGRNVVYHEFAHKLDGLDGGMDGIPPVPGDAAHATWRKVMSAEYRRHREAVERGRATLLDDYGATNPTEFFAVATECFFERPARLRDRHGDLYALLVSFYQQDPEP